LGPGRRRLGGVGKPNHDAFWAYRASLAAFICRGNGQALDVGCGEGRVSRELTACGFQVTAVDPVSRLANTGSSVNGKTTSLRDTPDYHVEEPGPTGTLGAAKKRCCVKQLTLDSGIGDLSRASC
jgi:hypothetical protein